MKQDFNKDDHVVRKLRFEGQDLPKLTKDLIDIGARATTFAQHLWRLVQPIWRINEAQ
jgi:hypothetical protein